MSPVFRVNGTHDPKTPEYAAHVANSLCRLAGCRSAGWSTARYRSASPISVRCRSARRLRATIASKDGARSASGRDRCWGRCSRQPVSARAARFIVFTCADLYRGAPLYKSIDMVDAFHPQTILAWAMNDQRLSVGHGAPVQLQGRAPAWLQARRILSCGSMRSPASTGSAGDRAAIREDAIGYDWYAGI